MDRRKLKREVIKYLPEKVRLEVLRRNVRVSHDWPSPSLEIKIAESEEELTAAYKLLHDSYVAADFTDPHPSGMRVLPQHLLPQTTTIVAKWDGEVMATLSLIRDNPLGLPIEKIFDLSSRRAAGRRLAESSSLAVDPRYRGKISQVLFPMFRFNYHYARYCFGIHEIVCSVNPSTVDMYLAFLCFERITTATKSYDVVNGAPAVGLFVNFENLEKRLQKIFAHRPRHANFHDYWTQIPDVAQNRLPQRTCKQAADVILTPELLGNFYLAKTQLKENLNLQQIRVLLDAYPYPDFHQVIQKALVSPLKRANRMETMMTAQIGPESIAAEVWNVSEDGLMLAAWPGVLASNQRTDITIWINNSTSIRVPVQVRWKNDQGLFGLNILCPVLGWSELIRGLERPYLPIQNSRVA